MIDSIEFFGDADSNTAVNLNSVVNGVGISLQRFEPSYDVRMNPQSSPMSPGILLSPFQTGKMQIELEGDLMGTTPANYWTTRLALAKAFFQGQQHPTKNGRIALLLTGFPESIGASVHPVSPPQIPIGLAGATISRWMVILGINEDPWLKGITRSQTIGPNVSVALTDFANGFSNAPSWPSFTITGPITNPSLLWQGSTFLSITTVLGAGSSITVNMRDRVVRGGLGTNYYSVTSAPAGWIWFDPRNVPLSGKNLRMNGSGTTGATTLQITYYNGYTI